ncbi:YhfG family protein [Marinobacterium stanieri]|uniref:YhfG family protein n=1 Tax=Marinobacterium stanieri TaxID=49186 RepID=UPI00025587DC|nr:YhfG family protein [Marinobacterium stanieri]
MSDVSMSAKAAYFARVRHHNYLASLRLEGFPLGEELAACEDLSRSRVIARYAQKAPDTTESHAGDPYCYPDSNLLINRLNIDNADTLEAAEQALTSLAAGRIEFCPPPYDLAFMCQLHRQLFADLFTWAGKLRTTDIAKGNTLFCTVPRIQPEGDRFFSALADKHWLTEHSRDQLIEALAEACGDLNMVHPFREGNGRTLRLWCDFVIINAGFEVDWESVDREVWMQASIDAALCEFETMQAVFNTCIGSRLSSN